MTFPLTRHDITVAARELNTTAAAIKAVVEIEAASSGFDQKGRPRILFEPHVFERELNALGHSDYGNVVQRARRLRIASPTWDKRLCPRSQDGRWEQLAKAREIDDTAALKSASYGLGQCMGFNYAPCGYSSVQEMFQAMHKDEGEQLMAMVRFIASTGLDAALRNRDWTRFARGYNGPGYRRNQYDRRLNEAYLRHEADSERFWRGRSSQPRPRPKSDPAPRSTGGRESWAEDAFGW